MHVDYFIVFMLAKDARLSCSSQRLIVISLLSNDVISFLKYSSSFSF